MFVIVLDRKNLSSSRLNSLPLFYLESQPEFSRFLAASANVNHALFFFGGDIDNSGDMQ